VLRACGTDIAKKEGGYVHKGGSPIELFATVGVVLDDSQWNGHAGLIVKLSR
jgi:hypothetical protein